MRYEKDLLDHEPRRVHGVRGVKSRTLTKRFRNLTEMNKWLDTFGDDIEIYSIERA